MSGVRQPDARQFIEQGPAAGEFLDYASAEQAFMAVQMLSLELKGTALQDDIDSLARSLENDERYRPSQFARLLRQLDVVE